ncbi:MULTISPECIES: S-adenosylmethionine decarboxylase [unclassified Carboxylicivirga]|uniref:S-adenosylmethionine decarboxylase n=1 Tax=Carboxylicivirga TaxID=1628153 RepID=UPI003D352460
MELQAKQLSPQIFSLKGWIELVDPAGLQPLFNELLDQAEFLILNYNEHHFPLKGFTAFWLLAESHLALHTFADSGWCYIELSSCNKEKTSLFYEGCNQLDYRIKWEKDMECYRI